MSPASRHFLATFLVLLLGQATAEEPAGPKAQEIERLVKQLGSEKFQEREAAGRRLVQIGEAALPALRRAGVSGDAEVRRRASQLVKVLQSRIGAREARTILEQGVKALGGEEALKKYRGFKYTGWGTDYIDGVAAFSVTREIVYRAPAHCRGALAGPGQIRTTISCIDYGAPPSTTLAFDGVKAWCRTGTAAALDLPEGEAAEVKEQTHAVMVATLLPVLAGKGYKLELLGASKVHGTDSIGVRVSHNDRRDVLLFFGKKSGLLLKYQILVRKDGREVTHECYLSEYDRADLYGDGWYIQCPYRIVTEEDGKVLSTLQVDKYKVLEEVADREFAKP
jgi:hypothetical protein